MEFEKNSGDTYLAPSPLEFLLYHLRKSVFLRFLAVRISTSLVS